MQSSAQLFHTLSTFLMKLWWIHAIFHIMAITKLCINCKWDNYDMPQKASCRINVCLFEWNKVRTRKSVKDAYPTPKNRIFKAEIAIRVIWMWTPYLNTHTQVDSKKCGRINQRRANELVQVITKYSGCKTLVSLRCTQNDRIQDTCNSSKHTDSLMLVWEKKWGVRDIERSTFWHIRFTSNIPCETEHTWHIKDVCVCICSICFGIDGECIEWFQWFKYKKKYTLFELGANHIISIH